MQTSGSVSEASGRGFTIAELLVGKVVIGVAALLSVAAVKQQEGKNLPLAVQKVRSVGNALIVYTNDHGGLLPMEDAIGRDDWANAAKPEAAEVWYNALPKLMKAKSVGEIGKTDPKKFYEATYVLTLPGAPYPDEEKRLLRPYFAFGMNSRLQRKNENGVRVRTILASILDPVRTVIFLERGMPRDKKFSKLQRGFDASPKANPHCLATRHGGKGILLFVDGHVELHDFASVIDEKGRIHFPQEGIVWTCDPDEDPN